MRRPELTNQARRFLRKCPDARRIQDEIEALCRNPFPRGHVKLQGHEDLFRIRVGEYRIIYALRAQDLVILIISGREHAYQ
jgi:mRNA interferase RelE/StbE